MGKHYGDDGYGTVYEDGIGAYGRPSPHSSPDATADQIAGLLLATPPDKRTELMRKAYWISGVCQGCGMGNPAEPRKGCVCGEPDGKTE